MATTKFVAVLAQLKDHKSPGPGFTTAWLDQLCAVVRQYWLDMSGGRQDIAWSVRPNPLVLDLPLTPEVGSEALVLKARAQAASDGTPFAATEHLLVIRDWTAPGAGATATDPTVVGTALTPSLICHEMGHFFQRANHQPSGHASVFNGWISLDYVDGGCVMGGEGPKFTFPAVPPPILNAHNVAGPAMSPAMVDLCGWLDKGNPGAVLDGTHLLPFGTPIATWRGAPRPGHPGPHSVLTFDGLAPHGDRIYLSLRSPAAPWDAGFPPPPIDPARPKGALHRRGTPRLVAHELAPSGATYLLAECAAVPGAEMRVGRAPLHVGVVDTIADGVQLRLRRDPWRGVVEMQAAGPALDPASRVAAVARGERIDLFVVDRGGEVQGRHFDSDLWEEWYPVSGAGATPTSGLAVAAGSPAQLTVFVVDAEARLRRRRLVDGVWEEGWQEIAVGGLDQTASLAATASAVDRIELFATDDSGRVLHATVVGGVAGTWEVLPDLPRARSLAATMLTDRDISVHAVTEGAGDQRLWSIVGREGAWGEWVSHGQLDLAETVGVAAVSSRPGTADLVAAGDPLWARGYQAGGLGACPELITGSRCGDDSTVAAVSRTPECVDVIVVTHEGRIAVTSRSSSTDFRPAHRELVRRVRTSFVSPAGRFLTARPVGWTVMLFADATTQGPAEEFTIKVLADYDDGNGPKHVIAVQAHDGHYVCAEAGGGRELTVTRTHIDPWETFLMPAGVTSVTITALGGHLWSVDDGLDVRCDQVSKGDHEYFEMVPVL